MFYIHLNGYSKTFADEKTRQYNKLSNCMDFYSAFSLQFNITATNYNDIELLPCLTNRRIIQVLAYHSDQFSLSQEQSEAKLFLKYNYIYPSSHLTLATFSLYQ